MLFSLIGEESRAEQSRAEQSRAEQSRAEQSRAETGSSTPFISFYLSHLCTQNQRMPCTFINNVIFNIVRSVLLKKMYILINFSYSCCESLSPDFEAHQQSAEKTPTHLKA